MSVPDAGRQPERTWLAWQRTLLTGLAVLLVVIRLLVEVSPISGLLVGGLAVLVLIAPVRSLARWRRVIRSLPGTQFSDGRAQVLLAMVVTLACLAALGYVSLG